MAINISSHSGSTSLVSLFISVTVDATVYLQETDPGSGRFQCLVQYKYSGVASGSGTQTIPVSGNAQQHQALPHGFTLDVQVAGWTLTATNISFTLTASISGLGMGPGYLFHDTPFGGPLPATTMALVDERIAAHLAAIGRFRDRETTGSDAQTRSVRP